MDPKKEIRALAKIPETNYPFISLYLNTKWEDEKQRERVRLFVKNELKKAKKMVKDDEEIRKLMETSNKLDRNIICRSR